MVDSSGKYDTTDIHYLALKAYINNDSAKLINLDSIVQSKNNRQNWDLWDSDIPLPTLKQLNTEEAYRLVYSLMGLPAYESITISKKDSVIKLHYLYYRHDRENLKFEKYKEFEKNISIENWNVLIQKIHSSDFWGLKNDKEYRGRDGSDITMTGYINLVTEERYHYTHRWATTTLDDVFYFVYFTLLDKKERQYQNE